MRALINSFLSWLALQLIWWLLRVLRACSRESLAQGVHTLSKNDFTIVFWQEEAATPQRLQVVRRMSTAGRSTSWFRRWMHWRMWERTGSHSVEFGAGVSETTFTSSTPDSKKPSALQ